MRVVIVIPTFNERENISLIIPKIQKVIETIKKHKIMILVVDDNSPDLTSKIIKKYQKKYKDLYLLQGEKKGLGNAYLRGFDYSIKKLKADIVVEMDADFSHPPELIPELIKGIDNGFDVVIGSRYIEGGSTPNWDIRRKLISRFGNLYSRLMCNMNHLHDLSSGFRAIRVSYLKKIDPRKISLRSYAFQIRLLYELIKSGAKATEIPLVFLERKHGKSKLNEKDLFESIIEVIKIRTEISKKVILFLTIGAIVSSLNLIFLYFFVDKLHLEKRILSPSLSLEICTIISFLLNDKFTFQSKDKRFLPKFLKFHLASLSGFILNIIIYNAFLQYAGFSLIIGKYDYLLAQFLTVFIVVFWNYYINSRWTWKEKA